MVLVVPRRVYDAAQVAFDDVVRLLKVIVDVLRFQRCFRTAELAGARRMLQIQMSRESLLSLERQAALSLVANDQALAEDLVNIRISVDWLLTNCADVSTAALR